MMKLSRVDGFRLAGLVPEEGSETDLDSGEMFVDNSCGFDGVDVDAVGAVSENEKET